MIQRPFYNQLLYWKESNARKPLIIRGARQVGKTTLIKEFGKSYSHFVYLNLEKPEHNRYFTEFSTVKSIVEAIFLDYNISAEELPQTLLCIDEIQEVPKAIALLRYFYEELPDLHVITADSLVEFALADVHNFPVGRVEYLYLHPLNFEEFLSALGQTAILNKLKEIPIAGTAHTSLMNLFHEYVLIGGMPELVAHYAKTRSIASLVPFYESIWTSYANDIPKYAANQTQQEVINHIIKTAPTYVDERIKLQNFGHSSYRSREVGEAFRKLQQAGLVRLIYPTTELDLPTRRDFNKAPRMQFLDTGLVNYTLGIQSQLMALSDLSSAFKGRIIPHIIQQELISTHFIRQYEPVFWVRDKSQSSAEVDLILNHNGLAIPVEIKSGAVGSLRSLHQYINECEHAVAIRIYGGKFSVEQHKTIQGKEFKLMNLPYYLGTQLEKYAAYFLSL